MTITYKAPLLGSLGLRDSTHGRADGTGFRPAGAGVAQPMDGRDFCWFVQAGVVWSCWMSNSPPGGVQADEQHLQKGICPGR